jgi:uncharacterized damage-inducible protein DinB
MRLRLFATSSIVLALCVLASPALAQEHGSMEPEKGARAEMLADLQTVEGKFLGLAEAMSQEQYKWRPSEGIRSVSEVYMHVAGTNYFLTPLVGVGIPEGVDPTRYEMISDKAKVIETLKKSFMHLREAIMSLSDHDLEKPTNLFGRDTTYRAALMLAMTHCHEHLGQSIAYARINGVSPPWSGGEGQE